MFDRHLSAENKNDAPKCVDEPVSGRGHWVFRGFQTGTCLGPVASCYS